jgi:hypothetical protein
MLQSRMSSNPKRSLIRSVFANSPTNCGSSSAAKQSAASLVEGAYIEALANLLRPFDPPTISIGEDADSEMARDYYSGKANAIR